jgi:peptide/nickel transport system substrate-binding protein
MLIHQHKFLFTYSSLLLLSLLTCGLLMACGDQTVTSTTTLATTADSRATTVTSSMITGAASTTATVSTTQPSGELKLGTGINFPTSLTDTTGSDGYNLIFFGAGETLTRLDVKQNLQNWLADSVTNLDASNWQVKLKQNVKFWDGSPLNAQAVIDSFKDSWEKLPSADLFLSKQTQITATDDYTLNFKTPKPVGDFPHSLATWYFVIHKVGPNGSITTGLYQPTKLVKDQELDLEAFTGHWSGPPPIKKITVKLIPNANARVLALQAGDLNFLPSLPPDIIQGLSGDIEKVSIPTTRIHTIVLNNAKAPFSDKTVRQAMALGIDRKVLNDVTLSGTGGIATNLFPPNGGIQATEAQHTDVAQAKQLLDAAGWTMGSDNIRAKDGNKLSFTLYSYAGRAELTPIAVSVQNQLKPLGFDIKVQEVRDITAHLTTRDFDAAMYSINAAVDGDPQYMFGVTLVKGGSYNFGGYHNSQLDILYDQLRGEPDPARRNALSLQMQDIVKNDVPNIYTISPPLVTAYKKGTVSGFTPYPNDLYLIDRNLTVQS